MDNGCEGRGEDRHEGEKDANESNPVDKRPETKLSLRTFILMARACHDRTDK
jgi:hypothetical protein